MYKITIDYDAEITDKNLIRQGILGFNKKILGKGMLEKTFSVFLKDEKNKIQGGILAYFDSESVFVDVLWVDENSRHQGYGTMLLNAAEKEGFKLKRCYSTLDTWSFQAENFY
jgi:GNAT superfamily N-acetyltransferase